MDASGSSSAFLEGRKFDYGRVYGVAHKGMNAAALEGEGYAAVAVLTHDKDAASCQPIDFAWFRVKPVRPHTALVHGN